MANARLLALPARSCCRHTPVRPDGRCIATMVTERDTGVVAAALVLGVLDPGEDRRAVLPLSKFLAKRLDLPLKALDDLLVAGSLRL